MTIVYYVGGRIVGLSSDIKPTGVPEFSTFIESDTFTQFILVGGVWEQMGEGVAGATWAETENNIVDFSDSNEFSNVEAFRDLSIAVRARESGRSQLGSDFTGVNWGVKRVEARLIKNGNPDGSTIARVRDTNTHVIIADSNPISNSFITGPIAIYTFNFEPNSILLTDVDVVIAMINNTNGVNATVDIGVGYTGETGTLAQADSSDGDPTTGWIYATDNNARFTIVEDEKIG